MPHGMAAFGFMRQRSAFFKIASVLVRFDHAGLIEEANQQNDVDSCSRKSGKNPEQSGRIYDMPCLSQNELYVAEILNWYPQAVF